jgi:hypothetical protein
MGLDELLEMIGIDEPGEFEYFENFADLVESEEEVSEEVLCDLFRQTDPETVSEVIGQYFDDIMNAVTHEYVSLYALLDTLKNVLTSLILNDDEDEEGIERFSEELSRFREWYSFDSAVEVTESGSDASVIMTVKDAITVLRIGRLDNEDHTADFSQATDYEIDDYILDLASQSRDRNIDDPEEDYLENGYVYDN